MVRLWRLLAHAGPTSFRWQNRHSLAVSNSGTGLPTWSPPHPAGSSFFGGSADRTALTRASKPSAISVPVSVATVRSAPRLFSHIGSHPSVSGVLALAAALQVNLLELFQGVLGQRLALGLDV